MSGCQPEGWEFESPRSCQFLRNDSAMCNEKPIDLNQDLLDRLKKIENDPIEQEKAYQRMKDATKGT